MIVLITIAILVVSFFIWKQKKIKAIRKNRDSIDFSTAEGRFIIKSCNYHIDKLNGRFVFKRRGNQRDNVVDS